MVTKALAAFNAEGIVPLKSIALATGMSDSKLYRHLRSPELGYQLNTQHRIASFFEEQLNLLDKDTGDKSRRILNAVEASIESFGEHYDRNRLEETVKKCRERLGLE